MLEAKPLMKHFRTAVASSGDIDASEGGGLSDDEAAAAAAARCLEKGGRERSCLRTS